MSTQRPLRAMLTDIMQHVRNHTDYLSYNNRLFLVHEGQLRTEIEASLRKELSDKAYVKAIQRVPSINLLVRIIDKLSRVYSEPVERTSTVEIDQPLLQYYERTTRPSEKLGSANRMYNLHKCAAIEPFIQDGVPQLRVLPAHQFLVFSDDPINPLRPTVFIKFMGKDRSVPFTDRDGRKILTDEVREVQLYYFYSDDEIIIVDSEGQYREDRMQSRSLDGVNPLGRIPFVYINRSDFRLIPVPDTDTLENTILIPKLLADLNYAVQFQSHSIFVATDLDVPADMAIAPDTVWELKSSEEGKQGRIDAIKPSVDIDQVITLIKATLSIWLESRNIKAGDMGSQAVGDAASGVARIIDEADATQDRQIQAGRFADAERDLWNLVSVIHNHWVDTKQIEGGGAKFSDAFDISIRFGDQKPVVSDRERADTIQIKRQAGLMTRRQAVREMYPHLTDEQTTDYVAELVAEEQADGNIQRPAPIGPEADNGQENT